MLHSQSAAPFVIRLLIATTSVLFATHVFTACASRASASPGTSKTSARSAPVGVNGLHSVTEGFNDEVRHDVETLRNATANFHDVAKAQSAGYPTTLPKCIDDSTMGGMGRHYFDRAIYDGKLDVAHPEMLIYAPDVTGKPDKLVAVEYVVPFSVLPSTSKAPRLFGQELKRHDDFKYWYLHVWAWKKNKAGLFADWDPSIKCS